MKKLSFILALASIVTFSSCSDEPGGDSIASTVVEALDMDTDASIDSNFEDVDIIADAGMMSVDISGRLRKDLVLKCADVNHDKENKKITIDYGDGCDGPWGRTRKGKIIITYTDRLSVPGASRSVSFENFYVDSVKVEGTRTITNLATSADDNKKFRVTLAGGKLTFGDGSTATREATKERTWFRTEDHAGDSSTVSGSANGTKRDNTSYSMEIVEDLVYKRSCWSQKVFIPVKGVKQITNGDKTAVINYGNGECDNEVTITVDGETTTKTIEPRGRKKKRG